MNGKKIGLVIMTAMLMLLTSTLMPVVNAEPANKVIKQNEFEQRFIDAIGEDKYEKLEVAALEISGHVLEGPYWFEDWVDLLKELGLSIMQVLLIIFGRNVIGALISYTIVAMIIAIPVFLVSMLATCEIISYDIIDNLGVGSWQELFERVGIVGMILLVLLGIPILLIASVIIVPIGAIFVFPILMAEILQYISSNVDGVT